MQRVLAAFLVIAAVLWSAAILLAPFALTSRRPWLSGAAAVLYQTAGLICHQRPERSFHLAGVQQPVCGRCTGLYLSAAASALAAFVVGRAGVSRPRDVRTMLVVAALPIVASVALEQLGLVSQSNETRALSALPLGAVGAWVFIRSLLAEGARTAL